MSNARDKANIPALNFSSTGIDDNATSTAITIDSSEKIGVGSTTPSSDAWTGARSLVIKETDATKDNGIMIISSSTTNNGNLAFADTSGGGFSDIGGLITYLHNGDSFRFMTANTERMRLNSTGLGIGTSSPSATLNIQSSTDASIDIDATSGSTQDAFIKFTSPDNGVVYLGVDDSEQLFKINNESNLSSDNHFVINGSGNVGIGTSSPESALDVGSGTITQREGNVRNTISSSGTGFEFIANATSQNVTRNFVFKSSTSGGGVTERMRITSTGRVGIGTSSPAQALTIGGITSTPGDYKGLAFQSGSSEVSYVRSNCVNGNNYFLTFGTYASGLAERMRIDSSGNVGISTTSTSSANLVIATNSNSGSGIRLIGKSANGGAEIDYYNNANNTLNGFLEISDTQGTLSAVTNIPFTFRTNNTERMRIDTSGNVGINTTSPESGSLQTISHPGSSKYGLNLDSSNTSGTQYHLQFKRGGTQAGYITSNSATTIAVNNASDERLKENIQNSGSAIQDIKDMQVRQFDWIDGIDTHRDFGFVAQELVNVVPEAVTQGTDELDENGKPVRTWGVDYSHIVPRLVKVCQEQQTKIEDLEARITALETQP